MTTIVYEIVFLGENFRLVTIFVTNELYDSRGTYDENFSSADALKSVPVPHSQILSVRRLPDTEVRLWTDFVEVAGLPVVPGGPA